LKINVYCGECRQYIGKGLRPRKAYEAKKNHRKKESCDNIKYHEDA